MKGRLHTIRVHELKVGDMFRELGTDYKVMKKEEGKFICATITGRPDGKFNTGSNDGRQYGHTMGTRSQKLIQKYFT